MATFNLYRYAARNARLHAKAVASNVLARGFAAGTSPAVKRLAVSVAAREARKAYRHAVALALQGAPHWQIALRPPQGWSHH